MSWKKEESCKIVSGNQETVWDELTHRGLGLPNELQFLPYFSSSSSHDRIYEGMKSKIVGSAGTVNIATLSTWSPQQKRLKLSIHSDDDPQRKQWQHLEFSVNPTSKSDESEICLTIETSTSIDFGQVIRYSKTVGWGSRLIYWLGLIGHQIKRGKDDYNYAEGVLHPIVHSRFTRI